jgi:hypothetical protein
MSSIYFEEIPMEIVQLTNVCCKIKGSLQLVLMDGIWLKWEIVEEQRKWENFSNQIMQKKSDNDETHVSNTRDVTSLWTSRYTCFKYLIKSSTTWIADKCAENVVAMENYVKVF